MGFDRISNLPSPITEIILSRLPIKDAVRTSVLSSQWRYKAAMLQHLVFDYECCSARENATTFANIVDHVLLTHIGPIHKFELARDQLARKDIDRWILHLSRNSIKELIFHNRGPRYKIPSCLFSCHSIISLELLNCLLEPPSNFKGFKNLKSLDIQDVAFSQDVLQHLIASCPVLESLSLVWCDNFKHLRIDAPNLKILDVRGSFKDIVLENTLNLVDVSIGLEAVKFYVSQSPLSDGSSNLVRILSRLPRVQKLDFYICSLTYMAIGAVPVKLPTPCLYLNCLGISLTLTRLKESLTALCMFRSCPSLQELNVQVHPAHEVGKSGNSWLDENRRCSFKQLRCVFINDIGGSKAELNFVRYLLLNAPVLEKMTIQPVPGVEASKLEKNLLGAKRASMRVKTIFQDQ
ncbi:hypothetical protein OROHE_004932 [Orobanche hederae]